MVFSTENQTFIKNLLELAFCLLKFDECQATP